MFYINDTAHPVSSIQVDKNESRCSYSADSFISSVSNLFLTTLPLTNVYSRTFQAQWQKNLKKLTPREKPIILAGEVGTRSEKAVPGGASWAPRGRSEVEGARLAVLRREEVLQPMFSKISKICNFFQFFGGLVLGCTKTKFCKKICVWQHFSISTRCAHFAPLQTHHF